MPRPPLSHLTSVAAAAAVASCAVAGDGGQALLDDLRAWWQFDVKQTLADEADANDLSIVATPLYGASPTGVGRALRTSPSLVSAVGLADGDAADHWASVGTGQLSTMIVFRLDVLPGDEDAGALVSKWGANPRSHQWRLGVTPEGRCSLRLNLADASTQEVGVDGLVPTRTYFVFTVVDEVDGDARLRVVDDAGTIIGDESAPLAASVVDVAAPFEIGRWEEAASSSLSAHVDLVSMWSRVLATDEMDTLAGGGMGTRYAHVAGSTGVVPDPARHMDRVRGAFTDDMRHIALGDSFCNPFLFSRVFPAILKYKALTRWTGLAVGAKTSHVLVKTFPQVIPGPGEVNPRPIEPGDEYRVEYLGGTDPQDRFALHIGSLDELRCHTAITLPGDGSFWRASIRNADLEDGATGRFTDAGDRVMVRMLTRGASSVDRQHAAVRLVNVDGPGEVRLGLLETYVPRQITASAGELELTGALDRNPNILVSEEVPGAAATAGDEFIDLAGFVYRKVDANGQRIPGQHYTYLADSSWTLGDFGEDVEPGPGNIKAFTQGQLSSWLAATTIDPAQPIVIWWYVDAEDHDAATTAKLVRTMVDLADAACADAGLPRPAHCVVVPHVHRVGNRTDDQLTLLFERYRNGIFSVTEDPAYDHVAAFSIYDATDGVWFDGRADAASWLSANGYDAFEYGVYTGQDAIDLSAMPDLLDGVDLHPSPQVGGVFFASFLADAVPDGDGLGDQCPADVDDDGVVGFPDLLALLSAWGPCGRVCPEDLDENGVVDFADLLVVLSGWGRCE